MSRRAAVHTPLLLLLLLLLLHCSDAEQALESDHTAKAPVYVNSPYFWAQTDYATFRRAAQWAPFQTGNPLLETHPISTRLQAWANRMHEEVAKDVLAKTGTRLVAPRPTLVIVPAKSENAWVSGIPACISREADLSAIGKPGRRARSADLVFLRFGEMVEAVSLFGAPPPRCVKPDNWGSVDEAVAFAQTLGAACTLQQTARGLRVLGRGCILQGDRAPTSARAITYYATTPYVHFTTAMIAAAHDERAIVGVIAHELGHYYRSHVVSDLVMDKYNYWYEQTLVPEPKTPKASEDSDELKSLFRRVMPVARPKVTGQALSYRLSSTVVGIGRLLQDAPACSEAAQKLGPWTEEFDSFGKAFASQEASRQYLAYETALLGCADRVPITPHGDRGSISRDALLEVVRYGASAFSSPPLSSATLGEALRTLQHRTTPLDREELDFLSTMRTRRLGHYTAEQEADEFSVEYYARVGLVPKTRVESYFALIKTARATDFAARNDGMDLSACEALYENGWTSRLPSGRREPAFVPLGSLHDPHHGDCYRLFNMSRDVTAHKTRKTGRSPSFSAPWSEIQDAAKRITEAFDDTPMGPDRGPVHTPEAASNHPPGGVILDDG